MKKLLIKKFNSLPQLPKTIMELEDFRMEESDDIDKLIEIIQKDPLMVVAILKVANSSMFGFKSNIETISRAINLLGINFTISIAIGFLIQKNIQTDLCAYAVSIDDFLYTSALATNVVNTWISSIDFDLKNDLLLPAFLQEVGKFVISDIIQEKRETEFFLKDLDETNDTAECEEKYTGFSCARITANIFKKWGFSHKIIFPIAFVGNIKDCPNEFKQKVQILEIVKILCDIRNPMSDANIQKAIEKAAIYGFDIEHLLNCIDVIKESMDSSS